MGKTEFSLSESVTYMGINIIFSSQRWIVREGICAVRPQGVEMLQMSQRCARNPGLLNLSAHRSELNNKANTAPAHQLYSKPRSELRYVWQCSMVIDCWRRMPWFSDSEDDNKGQGLSITGSLLSNDNSDSATWGFATSWP